MVKELKLIQARVDKELYNDFKTKVKRYHQKTVRWLLEDFMKTELLNINLTDPNAKPLNWSVNYETRGS